MGPLVTGGHHVVEATLSPLSIPPPAALPTLARFGVAGIRPTTSLARSRFETDEAQGLLAGLAAPLDAAARSPGTGGFGLFMGVLGHLVGWPLAAGGSQAIADALVSMVRARGARSSRRPGALARRAAPGPRHPRRRHPAQLVDMAGDRLAPGYRRRLGRFAVGPASGRSTGPSTGRSRGGRPTAPAAPPCTWGARWPRWCRPRPRCTGAATPSGRSCWSCSPRPSIPAGARPGATIVWAYCHVPNGSTVDMTDRIESQIERFAPGLPRPGAGPPRDEPGRRRGPRRQLPGRRHRRRTGRPASSSSARPVLSPAPWRTPVRGSTCARRRPRRAGRARHVRVARGADRAGRRPPRPPRRRSPEPRVRRAAGAERARDRPGSTRDQVTVCSSSRPSVPRDRPLQISFPYLSVP